MRKILFLSKFYFIAIFRFLFSFINGGYSCVVCGKRSCIAPLCKNCRDQLYSAKDAIKANRCECCGKRIISAKNNCMQCRENQIIKNIDHMLPLYSYRLWNKELLFTWKMLGIRSLSKVFSDLVADALAELKIEYIVPVPPRPGKIREQGWDQIDELCRILKYFYGFKILDIIERKSKIQQKKLDRNERLESISLAYDLKSDEILKKNKYIKHGEVLNKVCLIDDVCTTGATLEFCSTLLKKAGIKSVYAVTLFSVD